MDGSAFVSASYPKGGLGGLKYPLVADITKKATLTNVSDVLQGRTPGVIVSAVTGYVTIKYFLRFLAGHRLDVFAGYRLVLAATTLVWLMKH